VSNLNFSCSFLFRFFGSIPSNSIAEGADFVGFMSVIIFPFANVPF
jgi:hypothetical protein